MTLEEKAAVAGALSHIELEDVSNVDTQRRASTDEIELATATVTTNKASIESQANDKGLCLKSVSIQAFYPRRRGFQYRIELLKLNGGYSERSD